MLSFSKLPSPSLLSFPLPLPLPLVSRSLQGHLEEARDMALDARGLTHSYCFAELCLELLAKNDTTFNANMRALQDKMRRKWVSLPVGCAPWCWLLWVSCFGLLYAERFLQERKRWSAGVVL
jgi:hypothetical protein